MGRSPTVNGQTINRRRTDDGNHHMAKLRPVINKTKRALGRTHVPPTKVFPRLVVNKTILKPRLAAATGAQYLYVGFSRRNKIPRCNAHDIRESNPFPDYNPDRAQKLISLSMSQYLSTRNISSKAMHAFLSNLANRQTDRQTDRQTNAGKRIYLLALEVSRRCII